MRNRTEGLTKLKSARLEFVQYACLARTEVSRMYRLIAPEIRSRQWPVCTSRSITISILRPAADLILVPGGGVGDTAKNEKVTAWLNGRATKAGYMMSVCNGAFILANAGLLDGLRATTTASHVDELADHFPKVRVVRERYVDNGRRRVRSTWS